MIFHYLVFLSFLFSAYSASTKPKLCINCKHFIKSNTNDIYGKCALFPHNTFLAESMVNGKTSETTYNYCSTARHYSDMCGLEGKHYVKKYKKRTPK